VRIRTPRAADALQALAVRGALACLLLAAALARATSADPSHIHPAVPATIAGWARGAQLFPGLGEFHRPVTTGVPLAQQYFDQGMRLVWAFNHDEAARSFAQALELDPDCAGCAWGLALALGPNYNMPRMDAARAQVAARALEQARAHLRQASAVEQALIDALAARYPDGQALDAAHVAPATQAYAEAMRSVAARFPDDLDVATLAAEAQMNVHAWQLWTPEGQPASGTRALKLQLERVLARAPEHPGANHYYIHVMEGSPQPQAALPSAQRLRDLMPASGHLEHMPAHIFQRIGRYEDAADANRRAIAADLAYLRLTQPLGYYGHYLAHNYAFLAYAAATEGRKAETLAAVEGLKQHAPVAALLAMGDSGWGRAPAYAALVRFGLWDETLALTAPQPDSPGERGGYLYARGVALAARGRLDEARTQLAALHALRTQPGQAEDLAALLAVAEPVVAARIAESSGNHAEASSRLIEAVTAEDRLPYAEPAQWFFPVRQLLGAQLLIGGQPREAERVYREDLRRNPANGWSLYGLAAALTAQGRDAAAAKTRAEFARAWSHADVRLVGSAFWFAGVDTTSCECQRQDLSRAAGGS
jgi:tetratricopeptide (TPR) repeat protein